MSIDESTLAPENGSTMTVAVLAAAYLVDLEERPRLAPRTAELRRQQLRDHVVPLLGAETLAATIRVRDLRRMVRELERRGLGGSAIRSCVAATSALFVHAVRVLEVVERNPVRDLERGDLPSGNRTTEPRYLSAAEVERLVAELTPTFRSIAATCYWAGLRISEALSLRWRDLDFVGRVVRVPGSKTQSSNATVPLIAVLAAELEKHRAAEQEAGRFAETGLVFQTHRGKSPGRRNAHRAVARAAVKAGLVPPGTQPVGLHDLRHSFAALLLENEMSLVETSRLLRHANVSVTARTYAGITDAALARLGARIDAITSADRATPDTQPALHAEEPA